MWNVFLLTFNKVGIMLCFIAVGYFLRRHHDLPDQAGRVLSLLCTLLFAPAYSIRTLSKNFTIDALQNKVLLIACGTIMAFVAIGVAFPLSRLFGRSRMEKNALVYAFTFSNTGYFGYPVIEGVFGQTVLADFMIFMIPIGLATNSFGYSLFTNESKRSWKRVLLSPPIIGVLIGASLGLSGLSLPMFVDDAITAAGNCMSPCSMLLAGFMLGKFPLRQLLTGWKPYIYSLVRMVGIPLIYAAPLLLCGVGGPYLSFRCCLRGCRWALI